MTKIKIPKRFKKQLEKRFSIENFEIDNYNRLINRTPCVLCKEYRKEDCMGCPFKKYYKRCNGCLNFLSKILVKERFEGIQIDEDAIWISIDPKYSTVYIHQLANLLEKIKEYAKKEIEFI